LIVELANSQKFKCAICGQNHSLIVEHDHEPEEGRGDIYTVHNIRGLVCKGCNWHLMIYERDQRGEHRGWDNVDSSHISDSQYEGYVYDYECRVGELREAALERRLGTINYYRRKALIDKFDEWDEYGSYPWRWGFEDIKAKRHGLIRTPMQLVKVGSALMKFVMEEEKKDPNYQPPDDLLMLMFRMHSILDSIRPSLERRLETIRARASA
jgi:hypothetical protein